MVADENARVAGHATPLALVRVSVTPPELLEPPPLTVTTTSRNPPAEIAPVDDVGLATTVAPTRPVVVTLKPTLLTAVVAEILKVTVMVELLPGPALVPHVALTVNPAQGLVAANAGAAAPRAMTGADQAAPRAT